jgi:hypothetical protein
MGRLEPQKSAVATAWTPRVRVACDRCGFSRADGKLISYARFAIKTPKGALHFCAHHWYKHRWHIFERAYETTEL